MLDPWANNDPSVADSRAVLHQTQALVNSSAPTTGMNQEIMDVTAMSGMDFSAYHPPLNLRYFKQEAYNADGGLSSSSAHSIPLRRATDVFRTRCTSIHSADTAIFGCQCYPWRPLFIRMYGRGNGNLEPGSGLIEQIAQDLEWCMALARRGQTWLGSWSMYLGPRDFFFRLRFDL